MKSKVICIVGPTASGKSSLAIEVAKCINAEIISADSMQIYKGLDIGTAKVTAEEQSQIKHHLIDICSIEEKFSVADFQKLCYEKIEDIQSRGKNVVIVGGTGLYISAIVKDMNFDEQEIDEEYRNSLYELAKTNSNEYVWNILNEIDSQSAKLIHKNNLKRVVRAIEIAKYSNNMKSQHMENEQQRILKNEPKYDYLVFYIDFDREKLYNRINIRVDEMIQNGLQKEAKMVYDMKLPKTCTCMQAIGYKEYFPLFEGTVSLEQVTQRLKQETRNYAKRQVTWFKNKLAVITLDGQKNKNELVNQILDKFGK